MSDQLTPAPSTATDILDRLPLGAPQMSLPDLPRIRNFPGDNEQLLATARRFEAAFLTEMLRHTGLGKMPDSFNGGAGEAAFSGSLIQEYATRIAESGGVGLADSIFQSLLDRQN